jgi:transketolase
MPEPQVLLIATGSEVVIALEAQKILAERGIPARVVSMPCRELFRRQPAEYREAVLPSTLRARVVVEAGATLGWGHEVGLDGAVVGLDRFGASAPYEVLYRKLGLTPEAVAEAAVRVLEGGIALSPVPARTRWKSTPK